MKKSIITLSLLPTIWLGMISCSKETQVSQVELSETLIVISEGETCQLSFKVLPEEMAQVATWRALDPAIATITENGLVTGVSGGTTYVTATSGSVTSGCKVSVVAHVSGVKLNIHNASIERGEVFQLIPEVLPTTAYNKNVTWSSTNPEVAFVGNSIVSGISMGKADIVVKTEEGGYTDTCHVEVISTVQEVKLDKSSAKMNKGETLTLNATVLPEDATYKDLSWSTSDISVASVNESGVVMATGKGKCTITATSLQAKDVFATCEIEVYVPVKGVQMEKSSLSLYVGDRAVLKAQVLPEDANNQIVSWSSSSSTIAKVVAATGVVTAVKAGTATVTVKTSEGAYTDQCVITIIQGTAPVTGIELDRTSLRLRVGGTYELYANVLPADAANKGVTWSSDNTTVASVDTNGKVTAKDAGTCVITAKTKEGNFAATCTVKVVGMDTSISDGLDDNAYIWQN